MCLVLGLSLGACKKEVKENTYVDRVVYNVDGGEMYLSSAEKTKPKSSLQFLSVLYSQVFQKAISVNELLEMENVAQSIGDNQLFYEVVMGKFLSNPEALLWTDSEMQQDREGFIDALYLQFFNRKPDSYEIHQFKKWMSDGYEPTDFYWGVLLSNEYAYY